MALITLYLDKTFRVIDDSTGTIVLWQPFKPSSTGEQLNWNNEQEALEWWETQKVLFTHTEAPVIVETPTEEPPAQ